MSDRKNSEGYSDPTAYQAILPIMDRIITADKVINKIREEEG